jgi:L-iditol 2-dehydrogenase
MQVAMFTALGKVELQDIPRPVLKEGEVLVKIEACGMCATDTKSILRGHPFWKPPRVLGHEMVGRVVEINGETDVSKGDRVFVCSSIPCGRCYFCRRGSEKMCINKKAEMTYPGGFSEYVSCPPSIVERGLLPIPEKLSSAVASLCEPFGCAIRAMKMTRFNPGSCVLIVGDGNANNIESFVQRAMPEYSDR